MEKFIIHLSFIMTGVYFIGVGIDVWLRGSIYAHVEVVFICFVSILLGLFMLFVGASRYQIHKLKHLVLVGLFGGLSFQFYVNSLGMQNIKIVLFLFHLGVFILLYLSAPSVLKPIALFPLLLDPGLIRYTALGIQGMIWIFFLLLMALFWKRERVRAFFYGLTCSLNPSPWILAPFLLIRIWKETAHGSLRSRMKTIGVFILISGLVFLIFNFIFILDTPKNWSGAILAPVNSLKVILEYGRAIVWVQFKRFYTLSSFVTLVILMIMYFLNFTELKHTVWVFPGLILWLSYRGVGNYFFYWTPMFMVSLYSLYAEYAEKKNPS